MSYIIVKNQKKEISLSFFQTNVPQQYSCKALWVWQRKKWCFVLYLIRERSSWYDGWIEMSSSTQMSLQQITHKYHNKKYTVQQLLTRYEWGICLGFLSKNIKTRKTVCRSTSMYKSKQAHSLSSVLTLYRSPLASAYSSAGSYMNPAHDVHSWKLRPLRQIHSREEV